MNRYGLTFHHFGLAARQPEPAAAFLRSLDYQIGPVVSDLLQNVDLIFCTHESMPAVEVITPRSAEDAGPLTTYLRSAQGLIYHVCYECPDIAATLAGLAEDGHKIACISEPKPAVLFGGRLVSFYRMRGFGTFEVVEKRGPVS